MSEFYGRTDDETSKQVLLCALENGVTLLDTADTYGNGHNERLIGDVLKTWDGDVVIATKCGGMGQAKYHEINKINWKKGAVWGLYRDFGGQKSNYRRIVGPQFK